MVYRVFVEKKSELAHEAKSLLGEVNAFLGIKTLEKVRVINRYDAENITPELFEYAKKTVFSEPQLDVVADSLTCDADVCFAVEYLPGQFDQRADSAAQCIQIISKQARPLIRTAKVYMLYGKLTDAEIARIKKYVINHVEAHEASFEKPETLNISYDKPAAVRTLEGFTALDRKGLERFVKDYALAMDADDIAFCQAYFKSEHRDPTITEIRMIDTYWSDHCRHTTFLTVIDDVKFEDALLQKTYEEYLDLRRKLGRTKPVCLMDLATVAVKALKKQGKLDKLDESEEINACTVKINAQSPDRNRTVRRRGNVYRRRYPRSSFGAFVRLRSHACNGCRRSAETDRRDIKRQTAAKEDRYDCCRGILVLWQPDRSCYGDSR